MVVNSELSEITPLSENGKLHLSFVFLDFEGHPLSEAGKGFGFFWSQQHMDKFLD